MLVFLDFEASSLGERSYPIEVGWVFERGEEAHYLISPAPGWTDWDSAAETIHRITRDELRKNGEPHDFVANRMVEALSGYELLASAPSWDGKWLSALLRAAGFPRHQLRLRRTDDAIAEAAKVLLAPVIPADTLGKTLADLLGRVRAAEAAPAHRALADARAERQRWLNVMAAARAIAAEASVD